MVPTSKMKDIWSEIMEKILLKYLNGQLVPTEKWAGGSIPINIVYQINDF